jgi:hypothetical protein
VLNDWKVIMPLPNISAAQIEWVVKQVASYIDRQRRIIHWFAPYVADVIIAGHDRNYLAVMLVPNVEACRTLAPELSGATSTAIILGHEAVVKKNLAPRIVRRIGDGQFESRGAGDAA